MRWFSAAFLVCVGASCGDGEAGEGAPAGDAPGSEAAGEAGAASGSRPSTSGGVRLLARREVSVPGRPIGVLARDVDGDGIDDVVCVTRAPGRLVVLRGTPEGLVPFGEPVALGDDYPLKPLELGEEGIAVALQGTREVLLFASVLGDELPVRVQLRDTPAALGHAGGDTSYELYVLPKEGVLTGVGRDPESGAPYGMPFHMTDRVVRPTFLGNFGEVTVMGDQLSEDLLFLGGHGGAPRPDRNRQFLGGIPRASVEIDLDGDADKELVIVGGDRSVWAIGLGAQGLDRSKLSEPPPDLGAPGAIPIDVEAADLDGDGRDELVMINFYDSGYGVLGAFGPDGRPALVEKEYAGQDPVDGAVGDFDGDGNPDLAVANRGAGRVSLILGTGFAEPGRACFYQSRRVPCAQNPTLVRSANLDDDPLPEAVVVCAGDQVVQGRRNRFGLLEAQGPTLASGSTARALFAGERTPGAVGVSLLEAREGGARFVGVQRNAEGFAVAGALPAGEEARALAALEGADGVTLVAVDTAGRALHVLSPDARESQRVAWERDGGPLAACAVDVDGDGVDELAVVSQRALGVLALDAGAPTPPEEGAEIALPRHTPKRLAAGDINGDGREDLVLLYAGERDTAPGRIAVLLNQAAGGWTRAALEETGLAPAALAVGDVDGDGRAEIFCAAQNSHNVNAWSPRTPAVGAGLLRRLPDLGAGLGPLDVHLVDLDGDGRLDLVTANNFSHDLSVAYNLSR